MLYQYYKHKEYNLSTVLLVWELQSAHFINGETTSDSYLWVSPPPPPHPGLETAERLGARLGPWV